MATMVMAAGGFNAAALRQDFAQESARQTQLKTELKTAQQEKFKASLPGNGGHPKKLDIRTAAAELENVSLAFNKRLKFVVDHESHEVTVKVIDGETDKVIKVLPPEELQRVRDSIEEAIGFLFDEKV